ncbi:conserved Plasmodium protein, unknown function [Plasmodium knowlesi strain H]|uniref:SET domain-containing protein n=3 Tax=Plasmodium knowlesi TaxID=5850 RepID=A0A5K1UKI1_PLAKH|nr:conserved Plasmodium protein, unknown function [Plasmodium knowlesi strain H]OTN63646.1 Uncharacterized protein PKNOH_S140221900 [Plasmodium knowlesi]CAA9990647.1 conserved Plasmodium protein, unknown function [Plasmodium knowlesi strain H]SBO25993.1 conserved Plasmodium protein, unknown function [Plasmodium knowlesi strain H]SBO28711.1 conserved Plasmodium protein, unknown function [Plasmodium knowlesi strain H]VVS80121.1 conserved Plasmodium protein, unknown function [Plasmodium knowlesi |eukprot:XP_002261938.1 hypothetical protein, conserved in Plasmodium species [Plasmodium knowlesi strain H]
MNSTFWLWLKWALLLVCTLTSDGTKINFKRKKILFPSFTQNGWRRTGRENHFASHTFVRRRKDAFRLLKKIDIPLKLSQGDNIGEENGSLNCLKELIESVLHKKYEYKNSSKEPIFTISHLASHFMNNSVNLQNVQIDEQDRDKYTYEKNRIGDFLTEHNIQVGKNLGELSQVDTNVPPSKEQSSGSINGDNIHQSQNDDNKNYLSDENKILCLTAKNKIKKEGVICSIPSSNIIHFDYIMKQIRKYVDLFSSTYNVNYIKYIFKNNMEDEIKELHPLTILLYDIYKRHVHFLSFMKSPFIFLKFWDVKLTLVIMYVHFLSKYVTILLHAYNFNNTFFVFLGNYLAKREKPNGIMRKNSTGSEEERYDKPSENQCGKPSDTPKDSLLCNANTEEKLSKPPHTHIDQTNFALTQKTNDILKEKTNFFFYKNYEHYINYIVNKKRLSHLPLLFSDSSFLLFNNMNMKNIIYFRRQMLHEILNLLKSEEHEDSNFLLIHKNAIRKILFTNNKYYQRIREFLPYLDNFPWEEKRENRHDISPNHTADINRLYHFALLVGESNENGPDSCPKGPDSRPDGQCNHTSGGAMFGAPSESLRDTIQSITYTESLFESLDNFVNYNFLMRIYSYVSSHAIRVKGKVPLNWQHSSEGEKNINQIKHINKIKEGENNPSHSENYELNDKILSSNVKMEKVEKAIHELTVEECAKHDFNQYEKAEKEEENKYMCLIPIIDICNHSNFSNNCIIKKEMKKRAEVESHIKGNLKMDSHSRDDANETNEMKDILKEAHIKYNPKEAHDREEDLPISNLDHVQLVSSKDIDRGEEITISYGNLSNDLLLLEYGFVDKQNTKVYFHFDVKIVREIIIQILGFDKLPLTMLESLPQVKVDLFKKLHVIQNNANLYERFDVNNMESAKITRKKKEILKDYVRKNKYFNEYNIFTMKDRINKFYIEEKLQHSQKKNYLYIGTEFIVDPILLATIRVIIYDDLNHLAKVKVTDLVKWEYHLSPLSEIVVLQILIKLIDEIIYEQFYHINYEEILKKGKVPYSDLKFLQNKFLQKDLFNSEKSIDVSHSSNFKIVIYNIMKLKELQNARSKLTEKLKQMKGLIKV